MGCLLFNYTNENRSGRPAQRNEPNLSAGTRNVPAGIFGPYLAVPTANQHAPTTAAAPLTGPEARLSDPPGPPVRFPCRGLTLLLRSGSPPHPTDPLRHGYAPAQDAGAEEGLGGLASGSEDSAGRVTGSCGCRRGSGPLDRRRYGLRRATPPRACRVRGWWGHVGPRGRRARRGGAGQPR